MPSTEELKEAAYEAWQTLAPTWAKRRDFVDGVSAPVEGWLLAQLEPQPGQTMLELACGTGPTGLRMAEAVGPKGGVIATDFSPAMLEQARARAREAGAENVEHRVMDAQDMDLGDDSVDGVACRFGLMLMPEPEAALAETRRVLKPGGRVALAVWGPPDRNMFFAVGGMALVQGGHMDPPDPSAPGVFNMADEDRLRGLVEGAGFSDVRLEEIPVVHEFPSAEEFLATMADTAGPMAVVLRGLSDDELSEAQAFVEQGFAQFATDDGAYSVPGMARGAVATA